MLRGGSCDVTVPCVHSFFLSCPVNVRRVCMLLICDSIYQEGVPPVHFREPGGASLQVGPYASGYSFHLGLVGDSTQLHIRIYCS